jgi:K+-sensing histidine kinase KdpD
MSFEEMQAILQGILLSQQQFQSEIAETKAAADRSMAVADRAMATAERAAQIAESNGRAIQAMLEQAATDRLEEKERIQRHEEEMRELKATNRGLVNLTVLIDEDRPTILRLLNSNNNKLDAILDRLPPQQ